MIGRIAVVVALCFVTSLRFFALDSQSQPSLGPFKPVLAAADLAGLVLIAWLARVAVERRRGDYALPILLVAIAVAVFLLHGYFDDLDQKAVGIGGDRDDAVIGAVSRLLQFADPYGIPVFTGAPASPGPGWLILNFFAGVPGGFALLMPIHAAVLSVAVFVAARTTMPVLFTLLLCLGSAGFWENAYGSDISALALALAACTVALFIVRDFRAVALLAVVAGALATARLPLLVYPLLLGVLLLAARRRGDAIMVAGLGLIVALALHSLSAMVERDGLYPPLHLINQGSGVVHALGWPGMAVVLGLGLLLLRQVFHQPPATPADALWFQGLALLLMFAPVSLTSIGAAGWRFDGVQDWASYLVVAMPSLALAAVWRPGR